MNLVTTAPVAFENIFETHDMRVLGQRLNNDLDL